MEKSRDRVKYKGRLEQLLIIQALTPNSSDRTWIDGRCEKWDNAVGETVLMHLKDTEQSAPVKSPMVLIQEKR